MRWTAGQGVARHEVRRLLRSRPATNALLGGLAILAVLLVTVWPGGGTAPVDRSALTRELLGQLLRMQLVAFAVGAPLLVAGRLLGDGQADGWELVRTTPLGLRPLLRAKSEASLVLLVVLALALLPLWSACVLLGGVSADSLVGAILLVLGAVCWFTGAGVLGAAGAGRVVVAAVSAITLAVPGLAGGLWAAPRVLAPDGAPIVLGLGAVLVGLVFMQVAGAAAAWRLGVAMVRREAPETRPARPSWVWGHVGRLILGPRPLADWPARGNPFLLRETLADLDPRAASTVGVIMVAAVFAIGGLTVHGVVAPGADAWLPGVVAGGGTLVAMVAGAQMLPSERERDTLDLLRTVPGATRLMPWGKAAAALRLGFRVALGLGAFALPGVFIHVVRAASSVPVASQALGHAGWLLVAEACWVAVSVVGGAGVGALAGAVARSTTAALLGAAAMLAGLFALPALLKAVWILLAYPQLSLFEAWTHLRPFLVLTHPGGDGAVATLGPDPGRLLATAVLVGLGGGGALLGGCLWARRRLEASP